MDTEVREVCKILNIKYPEQEPIIITARSLKDCKEIWGIGHVRDRPELSEDVRLNILLDLQAKMDFLQDNHST